MSELRDEIRAVLAEMMDEAPGPAPFGRVVTGGVRRAWSGPVVAVVVFAAVLVVLGAVALLRPVAGPTLGEDVDGAAIAGLGLPTWVPDGFEPIDAEVSFGPGRRGATLTFGGSPAGSSSMWVQSDLSDGSAERGGPALDPETIEGRFTTSLPGARVTETTVRGRPAFAVRGVDGEALGWDAAVLVVESPGHVSQVMGFGLPVDDLLRVARGLQPVERADLDEWAVASIGWDIRVRDRVDDPSERVDELRRLPGVADVSPWVVPDLSDSPVAIVQRGVDDGASAVTTTSMVGTDASPRTAGAEESPTTILPSGAPTTVAPPGAVDVVVTLEPGIDPLEVARAVDALTTLSAGITFSPRAARHVTTAFFDTVLADATVINDDPVIYQPSAGPQPRFDTSDLGTEVRLAPASGIPARMLPLVTIVGWRGLTGSDDVAAGPILHIGALDDGTRLVLTFDGGADYMESTLRDDGSGTGGVGSLATAGSGAYGVVNFGGSSNAPTYVEIRVPLETSAVRLERSDGTASWQRPVAGHALIVIDAPAGRPIDGRITAYDADGTVIGEWQTPR